jgi:hypothetical protein
MKSMFESNESNHRKYKAAVQDQTAAAARPIAHNRIKISVNTVNTSVKTKASQQLTC